MSGSRARLAHALAALHPTGTQPYHCCEFHVINVSWLSNEHALNLLATVSVTGHHYQEQDRNFSSFRVSSAPDIQNPV